MNANHKIKPTIELYNRFSESVVNVYRFENRDALLDPDTGWCSLPLHRDGAAALAELAPGGSFGIERFWKAAAYIHSATGPISYPSPETLATFMRAISRTEAGSDA